MAAENRNDDNVVIPERAHDQPAEGGREQAAAASTEGTPDPEAEGIVDQQGAALQAMEDAPGDSGD
jgi:hypothetical protein